MLAVLPEVINFTMNELGLRNAVLGPGDLQGLGVVESVARVSFQSVSGDLVVVLYPRHRSRGRDLLKPNVRVSSVRGLVWYLSWCCSGNGDSQDREECWAH